MRRPGRAVIRAPADRRGSRRRRPRGGRRAGARARAGSGPGSCCRDRDGPRENAPGCRPPRANPRPCGQAVIHTAPPRRSADPSARTRRSVRRRCCDPRPARRGARVEGRCARSACPEPPARGRSRRALAARPRSRTRPRHRITAPRLRRAPDPPGSRARDCGGRIGCPPQRAHARQPGSSRGRANPDRERHGTRSRG